MESDALKTGDIEPILRRKKELRKYGTINDLQVH